MVMPSLERNSPLVTTKRELHGLTGLRGLAALWVFSYHVFFHNGYSVVQDGYLGVDIFFVLSGFILCYAHPRTEWGAASYAKFIWSRVSRLWPMHLLALGLTLAVVLLYPKVPHAFGANAVWRFGKAELLASALLIQNWDVVRPGSWNSPAWSLSAEWFASLIFPIFIIAVSRLRHAGATLVLALLCILAFTIFLWLTSNPDPSVIGRAGMVRLVCEFGAGALAYRAYALGYRAPPLISAIAIAVFALGVSALGTPQVLLFSLPFLILTAADDRSLLAKALSIPVLQFFGRISYSFYLLHWILLLVANQLAAEWGLSGGMLALCRLSLFAFTTALATITYRYVEVRCRKWLQGSKPARDVVGSELWGSASP